MTREARPLTGRTVLIIAVCAFGAIITANLALVYAALGSFPGVEVRNGYVASQSFEAERAAQERLGWRAEARLDADALILTITDRTGSTPLIETLNVGLGRPTTEAMDMTARMTPTAAGWTTPAALAPGLWRVDVSATGAGGEVFRQRLSVRAPG